MSITSQLTNSFRFSDNANKLDKVSAAARVHNIAIPATKISSVKLTCLCIVR